METDLLDSVGEVRPGEGEVLQAMFSRRLDGSGRLGTVQDVQDD